MNQRDLLCILCVHRQISRITAVRCGLLWKSTEHLTVRQAEVSEIVVENHQITGVKTFSGAVYHAKAVVLATGTYLKARCIYGDVSNYTGPNGLQAANHLTDSLIANGIEMFRFKYGNSGPCG